MNPLHQRHLLVAFLFQLAASSASAQMIRGTVRDAQSKEVVRNAFVTLLNSDAEIVYGVTVDERGRFSLPVATPGVYAVHASKAGYARQVTNWIEIALIDTFDITVRLARTINTLSPVLIKAQRDSIRYAGRLGLSEKAISGTIVTPAEVAAAAQRSSSAYDVVETLHIPSLAIKTILVSDGVSDDMSEVTRGTSRKVQSGTYRCIAYRRTNGCVMVVIDGQRFSDPADLLQLEGLLGPQDISYMIYLRPNEAGTLFGSETTNGVLILVRKGASVPDR